MPGLNHGLQPDIFPLEIFFNVFVNGHIGDQPFQGKEGAVGGKDSAAPLPDPFHLPVGRVHPIDHFIGLLLFQGRFDALPDQGPVLGVDQGFVIFVILREEFGLATDELLAADAHKIDVPFTGLATAESYARQVPQQSLQALLTFLEFVFDALFFRNVDDGPGQAGRGFVRVPFHHIAPAQGPANILGCIINPKLHFQLGRGRHHKGIQLIPDLVPVHGENPFGPQRPSLFMIAQFKAQHEEIGFRHNHVILLNVPAPKAHLTGG